MSRLDSLPPDQRAVLQLVLAQGRSYEDIAGMLRMEPEAVRSRAQAAAEALAQGVDSWPAGEHREDIVDYLLGQLDEPDRADARAYLAGSASGQAFARALGRELEELAANGLPEIPGEEAEPEPEPEAETPVVAAAASGWAPSERPAPRARRTGPSPRSSRLGGALLLAGVAIVVAVVVIVFVSDDDGKKSSGSASTQTSTSEVTPEAQINLNPAHKGSKALGVAQVLRQNGVRAMAIVGQDLPASTSKSFYAVWLYNSLSDAVRLGFTPAVGSDGKLQALLPSLPDNAANYKELVLSRETQQKPTKPSEFVLRGSLKLSGS